MDTLIFFWGESKSWWVATFSYCVYFLRLEFSITQIAPRIPLFMMLKRALQNEDTRHTHKNWSNHLERGGGETTRATLPRRKNYRNLKKINQLLDSGKSRRIFILRRWLIDWITTNSLQLKEVWVFLCITWMCNVKSLLIVYKSGWAISLTTLKLGIWWGLY